jgi:hypothetical protein
MAEDTHFDELSWSAFIDRLAGPLRLEGPTRQAYGLLMTLHLVREIWGDLAFLRGAARLAARHHFVLDVELPADLRPLQSWYRDFLQNQAEAYEALPHSLMKPAWRAEQRNG